MFAVIVIECLFWSVRIHGTGMDARPGVEPMIANPSAGTIEPHRFRFTGAGRTRSSERDVWRMSWGGASDLIPSGMVCNRVMDTRRLWPASYIERGYCGNELTIDLLDALERSAAESALVLQGTGAWSKVGGS